VSGDSNQEFRACKSGSTAGAIKLYPASSNASPVCVFPAKSGRALTQYGRFIYQCGNLKSAGSNLNFGMDFDSLYVVNANFSGAMIGCLAYGDPATCAKSAGFDFAEGVIQ
jgi:hypothetical protein